ncbi:MAG: hypothetical protein IAE65_08705 [Ignavibacteria bacterium]|nr:hypothetical protein [Ignavibacteria bacterium]
MKFKAVITGDIVSFTQLDPKSRTRLTSELKKCFSELERKRITEREIEIFRGDSFQGVINNPAEALLVALYIRSYIIKSTIKFKNSKTDARISIGIGKVNKLKSKIIESDGEAFILSGRGLDEMKNSDALIKIISRYEQFNEIFNIVCTLMEPLIQNWSFPQAEVVYYALNGYNQIEISKKIKITQASVNQRVKLSNWNELKEAINFSRMFILRNVK